MSDTYERECEMLTEHLTEMITLCYTYRDKLLDLNQKQFIIQNEIPLMEGTNE